MELLRLTATSRQVGHTGRSNKTSILLQEPRQYVQDLVSEEGSLLYRLWQEEGGALYVCGQVAMARAVQVDYTALTTT